MAVIATSGNAAPEGPLVAGTVSGTCLTWPAGDIFGAILVPVEECCGVLEQLANLPSPPAIAHIGDFWAFFVERSSIAALLEPGWASSVVQVPVDYRADPGLMDGFVIGVPLWIVEPSGTSTRLPTAEDVAAALDRAASTRSDTAGHQ
jgi:hypothetical protein